MTILEVLHEKILELEMRNQKAKHIYLGENEYRDFKAALTTMELCRPKLNFLGIEVIKVYMENHLNVSA